MIYIEEPDRAYHLLTEPCTVSGAGRRIVHEHGYYVANDRTQQRGLSVQRTDPQRYALINAWLDGIEPNEYIHSFHYDDHVQLVLVTYFEHLWEAEIAALVRGYKTFNKVDGTIVSLFGEIKDV